MVLLFSDSLVRSSGVHGPSTPVGLLTGGPAAEALGVLVPADAGPPWPQTAWARASELPVVLHGGVHTLVIFGFVGCRQVLGRLVPGGEDRRGDLL